MDAGNCRGVCGSAISQGVAVARGVQGVSALIWQEENTDPAQWRPLYDLHISTQVAPLIETIRHRAYVQYFEPFQNVQLARMATTFGVEGREAVEAFERDVVGLVQAGKLSARVDDIEKVRSSPRHHC